MIRPIQERGQWEWKCMRRLGRRAEGEVVGQCEIAYSTENGNLGGITTERHGGRYHRKLVH